MHAELHIPESSGRPNVLGPDGDLHFEGAHRDLDGRLEGEHAERAVHELVALRDEDLLELPGPLRTEVARLPVGPLQDLPEFLKVERARGGVAVAHRPTHGELETRVVGSPCLLIQAHDYGLRRRPDAHIPIEKAEVFARRVRTVSPIVVRSMTVSSLSLTP